MHYCISCGGSIIPSESSKGVGHCSNCGTLHEIKEKDGVNVVEQGIASEDMSPERKELLEKLRNLQKQHNDVSDMKKAMTKDYGDQLKDIKAEIDDTLSALEDTE